MIKNIKKFQIKLTPFDATKEWEMSTTNNQDVLLMDTSSTDVIPLALEFIDYGEPTNILPSDNSGCDIALEQQPDDLLNTRVGLNTSGLFYPQLDPVNDDGTYQRVVFAQVRTMFYNQFRDPTKTWGMNNIDFDLSKTKRKISDEIRLFNVPQFIYGDTVVPNSITLTDDSLDDVFSITDDGNGNLVAGSNLFSHRQEVGKYPNFFLVGSDASCHSYFPYLPGSPVLSSSFYAVGTSSLSWSYSDSLLTGFSLERSVDNSSSFSQISSFNSSSRSTYDFPISHSHNYFYRIQAYNIWGTGSYSNIVEVIP